MNKQQLRKEILELEAVNPELKEQFQKEIQEIIDRPLKPWERIIAIILIPAMLCVLIMCAMVIFFFGSKCSAHLRVEDGIVAVICITLITWAVMVLKKGKKLQNVHILPSIVFGSFTAMIAVSIMMTSTVDPSLLAATLVVGIAVIWDRIDNSELRIRENILRQELRLAQLAEKLERSE